MKTQHPSPEMMDIFERIKSRGLFFIVLAIIPFVGQNFISSLAATQVNAWTRIETQGDLNDERLLNAFSHALDTFQRDAKLMTDSNPKHNDVRIAQVTVTSAVMLQLEMENPLS